MSYKHGSNLLLFIGETALGHSKECKISNKSTTKKRAHKEQSNDGAWPEESVTELSVEITTSGFVFSEDVDNGYDALYEVWESKQPVTLKYAYRGEEKSKYRTGQFIISELSTDGPADDDSTYAASFKNSGPVTTVNVDAVEEG